MKKFASPAAFAAYLSGLQPAIELAHSSGVRDAGALIQVAARDSLGIYHEAVGPIPAWPELSERTQRERAEHGLAPDDPLLATGELQEHIDLSHDARHAIVGVPSTMVGDGSKANPVRNIGAVAVAMEMGTGRVPPRPFLSRAAFLKSDEAAMTIARRVGAAVAGVASMPPMPRDHIPF